MHSQDHINTPHSPGGGKSHVCTKCGWNYPNPHPSAKNRRAHKKICGAIKGYETLDSEMAKQNLDLQKDPCLDDDQKLPSPRVVEKADERIGDTSEEDVFADAVSEFSRSDSFKEKEETATNCCMAKSAKNHGETQLCTKSPEVVQESCEVPPVEILENFPKSVEAASENRQGGEPLTEGHSMAFVTLNDLSQVTEGGDTVSNVGLETDCKEDLPDESESKLASASGKRKDTFDSSWNDEVIYSDLEGPHGFAFEEMSMMHPGEAEYTVSDDNARIDTSAVETNADQVISTRQSARDDIVPFTENADVSLEGTKHEEVESNRSVNPSLPESPKGEECETDTCGKADNLGIQPEGISIGTEVPSLEHKAEPQVQTDVVAVKEYPSGDNLVISGIDPEDNKMKAEEGESSADVNHSDLTGHESELIQANLVAEENIELNSESSCAVQHYVSPVSVVLAGDNANDQRKSSPETSVDSILETGAETCESNDEARREIIKAELVKESSFKNVANGKDDTIRNFVSTSTAPDDSAETANHKLLESGRTEFNRVVGGLGVIQANEVDIDVKAHSFYAEVPVTIESNDHRDFGRLQNLSEAQIRSLVSSPLVTRNSTFNAFESTSGHSDGVNKPENGSQSSSLAVALSKNQEITMEKTASWSTAKEQHVPLKNLLSEARSPRLAAGEAKKEHDSNIPRVSSILLDQETSPEDGTWPERRGVSEEWNSPAKYPVELKREERKVKGRPFWVPFVCCSSSVK